MRLYNGRTRTKQKQKWTCKDNRGSLPPKIRTASRTAAVTPAIKRCGRSTSFPGSRLFKVKSGSGGAERTLKNCFGAAVKKDGAASGLAKRKAANLR